MPRFSSLVLLSLLAFIDHSSGFQAPASIATSHGHSSSLSTTRLMAAPSLEPKGFGHQSIPSSSSSTTTTTQLGASSLAPHISYRHDLVMPNDSSSIQSKPQDPTMKTSYMVKEVAALGIPALGGMLVDPIMSLVDTACVGQVCSTQLASLAPCTSIYQFFFMLFLFLSTTTTTLVAANPIAGITDEKEIERRVNFNEKVVSCASLLAIVSGVAISGALLAFPNALLNIAGCASPEMLVHGRKYLQIRALGLPFVFLATVLQGASLGRQDAWTPLRIFATAGIVNLVGDVLLTLKFGWGVSGAAVATVASQIAATVYYCWKSRKSTPNGVRLAFKGLPDKALLKQFSKMAVSLLLKSLTTMCGYSLLTKAAASLGALPLAAHQVTLQVWWLLSFIPEPASTVAQSLVARDLKDKPERVGKLVKVLYGLSAAAGGIVALLTGMVLTSSTCASAIVADRAVHALLFATAAPAMVAQVLCSLGSLSDGLAVGCGSFSHLPMNSALSLTSLLVALRYLMRDGVTGIWTASWAFFGTRVLGHLVFSKKLRQLLFTRNSSQMEENLLSSTSMS